MKTPSTILAAILLAFSAVGAKEPTAVSNTAPESNGWTFRFAPYAWLTAVDGDIGVGTLVAPVDISFSDTLSNLDMAFMFLLEANRGKLSLAMDFVYGDFSNDIAGGGQPFESFRYEYTQWVLTPTVGYRLLQTDKHTMVVFAGLRVTSFDASITGRLVGGGATQRGAKETWSDPIIGLRGEVELDERFFLRYNADVGGFGISSDLVWQAFLGIGYRITPSGSLAIGYRGLGVDYSSSKFSTMDMINHGPVLGFEFRF